MLRTTLLLLASTVPTFAQAPEFQPKPGSQWTRSHDLEFNVQFDRIAMQVNGRPSEDPRFEVQWNSKHHMLVEDATLAWDPKGIRQLERTYLEVRRERTAPVKTTVDGRTLSADIRAQGQSSLQGERVLLDSAGPGQAWSPSLLGESRPESAPTWLSNLDANLDYSLLLPGRGVKAGARWSVDAGAFLKALDASHGLPFDYESDANDTLPYWMGRVSEQPELTGLWDSFEHCSVHCQLMPERQIGHLRLLEVRVTAEFNGEADLTDWALQTASQTDSEEGPSAGSASQSTVLSGSGLYLWNLDTRTMHSFEFRATGKFAREQTLDSPQGDERLLIELSTEGQIRLEVLSASRR